MLRYTLGLVLVVGAWCSCITTTLAKDEGISGEDLFKRDWVARDALSPAGDGVGPMFNARSCVACHNQGGVGGGGANEHNVQLLTAVSTKGRDGTLVRPSMNFLSTIHPGFAEGTSVLLHRHSRNPAYASFRSHLLGHHQPSNVWARHTSRRFEVQRREIDGTQLIQIDKAFVQLTERNTPALFGLGMVDYISDEQRQKLVVSQAAKADGVNGRLDGKFGWRGQTAALRDFVLGACAAELGLQTRGNLQSKAIDFGSETSALHFRKAASFHKAPPKKDNSMAADAYDMDEQQLVRLVSYVAILDPLRREKAENAFARSERIRGKGAFSHAKCNTCHVADVGSVTGIYSDLLTHVMGPGLGDPAGQIGSSSGPYYGSGFVTGAIAQRWKTPPLWGVGKSAPYLHDGRAQDLETAILLHGGEAEKSRNVFSKFTPKQRRRLIAFVESL